MNGKFVMSEDAQREQLEWGTLGWLCHPPNTGADDLTILEVEIAPGGGHDFHRHPNQEEVIYVVSGEVEQWLEQESRTLRPGDSLFIDRNVVHATFNVSDGDARLLAILGPCDGESGYVVQEVGEEEPWRGLRTTGATEDGPSV